MANIVDTDTLNQYDQETGTFTSSDSSSPGSWQNVAVLASGETKPSIFAKISKMFANIRWLYSNKRTTGAFNSQSDTVTFTTADASSDENAISWTAVSQLTSGLSHATLLNRISAMMKNVRYLYNIDRGCYSMYSGTVRQNFDVPNNTHVAAVRLNRPTKVLSGKKYVILGSIELYPKDHSSESLPPGSAASTYLQIELQTYNDQPETASPRLLNLLSLIPKGSFVATEYAEFCQTFVGIVDTGYVDPYAFSYLYLGFYGGGHFQVYVYRIHVCVFPVGM